MLPAVMHPGFPATWPTDGRPGGVPDFATRGPDWIMIGTEGGFLPQPVVIPPHPVNWNTDVTTFNAGNVNAGSLILGPAERADVIVDFSQYAGQTLILYNDAPAPWPALDPHYDYYTGGSRQPRHGRLPARPSPATAQHPHGHADPVDERRRPGLRPGSPQERLRSALTGGNPADGVFRQSQDHDHRRPGEPEPGLRPGALRGLPLRRHLSTAAPTSRTTAPTTSSTGPASRRPSPTGGSRGSTTPRSASSTRSLTPVVTDQPMHAQGDPGRAGRDLRHVRPHARRPGAAAPAIRLPGPSTSWSRPTATRPPRSSRRTASRSGRSPTTASTPTRSTSTCSTCRCSTASAGTASSASPTRPRLGWKDTVRISPLEDTIVSAQAGHPAAALRHPGERPPLQPGHQPSAP